MVGLKSLRRCLDCEGVMVEDLTPLLHVVGFLENFFVKVLEVFVGLFDGFVLDDV